MVLNRFGRSAAAAMLLSVALMGCGGSDDDTSSSDGADEQQDTTDESSDDATTPSAPEDVEPSSKVNAPDCAALAAAAATLLDETDSPASETESSCQWYGGGNTEHKAWRLRVSTSPVLYPEMDFDSVTTANFTDATGMTEEDAPEDWNVAAARASSEEDPDFPKATTERFLYFGGPDVQGLLTCTFELTAYADPGQAPPKAPTIDEGAFLTFCNTAKEQVVTEA